MTLELGDCSEDKIESLTEFWVKRSEDEATFYESFEPLFRCINNEKQILQGDKTTE